MRREDILDSLWSSKMVGSEIIESVNWNVFSSKAHQIEMYSFQEVSSDQGLHS